jgi:chromosome segregation ATPase
MKSMLVRTSPTSLFLHFSSRFVSFLSALDLAHTQNIGQMLRTHFDKSQFIIVSLQDGMFNNANVIFKTKFVDKVSTVTRIAKRSK